MKYRKGVFIILNHIFVLLLEAMWRKIVAMNALII